MQFLSDNSFDFNKLFYESVNYMSMEDYKEHLRLKSQREEVNSEEAGKEMPGMNDPECVIFCNSRFE